MNKLASRMDAAITMVNQIQIDSNRQSVQDPDHVYKRREVAYRLQNAERFLRDAFFIQSGIDIK